MNWRKLLHQFRRLDAWLVPPALLKTASTGWRIARYYVPNADIRMAATQKKPAETMAVHGSTLEVARTGQRDED